MEKRRLCCIHEHPAVRICIEENCNEPALICDQKLEQCKNLHSECGINITVNNAIARLLDQGKISETVDDAVIQAFEEVIKKATVLKGEYLELMDEPQLRLKDNQRKLLKMLKQGPSQQIFPSFVMQTLHGISKPSKDKIIEEKNKMKIQLNKYLSQIQGKKDNKSDRIKREQSNQLEILQCILDQNNNFSEILKPNNVTELVSLDNKSNLDYRFSQQLLNKECLQTLYYGKRIRMIKNSLDQRRKYALIVPSPQESKNKIQVTKIRIINSNAYIRIGLCHLNHIVQNSFNQKFFGQLNHGFYVSGAGGWVYNSISQTQNNKLTDMRFQSGDIIQLTFNSQTQYFTIKNMSHYSLQISMKFNFLKNNPLHFCVAGLHNENQFQIC